MALAAHNYSIGQQALARAVVQFQNMEDDMRKLLAQKTDRAALKKALKKAAHASINADTSDVAKAVHKHLDEAILCIRWCFYVEFHN